MEDAGSLCLAAAGCQLRSDVLAEAGDGESAREVGTVQRRESPADPPSQGLRERFVGGCNPRRGTVPQMSRPPQPLPGPAA